MARTSLTLPFCTLDEPDGALGDALKLVLQPTDWSGQSDVAVLIPSSRILTLDAGLCDLLRRIWANQLVVVLTNAGDDEIAALHSIIGEAVPVQAPTRPIGRYDFYACARTRCGLRAFCMMPVLGVDAADDAPASDPFEVNRAMSLVDWIRDIQAESVTPNTLRFDGADAAATADLPQPIYGVINSWQVKTQQSVTYYWATCGTNAYSCQNSYQQFVNVWPVYSETNAAWNQANPGQPALPVDFFIMQLSGNMNTTGCSGFYGDRNHQNRIRAYWARQYNMSAATQDGFSFDDLAIYPDYNPKAANPSTTVSTGTSWNVGGTGTVGTQGSSIGFSAGATFTDSSTTTYSALETQPDIGSNSNVAAWTYDSWNYVHSTIQPSNQACGGAGLTEPPPIIYNGTFSPMQTWIWQASQNVREKYSGTSLPVNIDLSVLLAWTMYSKNPGCKPGFSDPEKYSIGSSSGAWSAYKAGSGDTYGLCFDVSCGVITLYGTIPLGPNNSASGNAGTPLSMPTWGINVPFAPLTISS